MIQTSINTVAESHKYVRQNEHDRQGHIREYCHKLLCSLPWPGDRSIGAQHTLGVTSCRSGEGVSTISAQLAVAAASLGGYRILLVDANIAEPSIHDLFHVSPAPGWVDILQDGNGIAKNIQTTSISNLSVLAAGKAEVGNISVGVDLGLPGLIKELTAGFDLVVFDLPPANCSDELMRLTPLLDGIVLVVEAERVQCDEVLRANENLTHCGARILGVALNKYQQPIPQWLARAL